MALLNCKNCNNEIPEGTDICPHCGYKQTNTVPKKTLTKSTGMVILIVVIGIILGIVLYSNSKEKQEQEYYDNLPIKVNISMTSYYGTIEYILYELGLDFDLVTMGANCYTGVQRNEFETEKYGLLHTEFRYCKSNETTVFRVYNDEDDQPLRDPKPGELPEFDKYGRRVENSSNSL